MARVIHKMQVPLGSVLLTLGGNFLVRFSCAQADRGTMRTSKYFDIF